MPKCLFLALLLVSTEVIAAPPTPYHIELEANPAAPFPFLGKFGKVTLHVYPAGVRAETFWLNGFSRNGMRTITVENPLGRMYTDVPLSEVSGILRKMSTAGVENAIPTAGPQMSGNVRGFPARRHRLVYGPEAWIDVWTSTAIPENPQLRTIVNEFVRGISPATARMMEGISGTPLYVELNFRRNKKLPLLRLKNFSASSVGQEKALQVGTLYFKAPLLDAIWK